ncbi:ATP-dependent Clp protease proteolytic subunit [Kribbella sp. NBC_01505]|uniref:ATP-dependent Clp protease proteolytic subunit n=1 Tax=Kribbella sp. NBC_01505 TaxID=2903580 RepID=UPI00386FBE96
MTQQPAIDPDRLMHDVELRWKLRQNGMLLVPTFLDEEFAEHLLTELTWHETHRPYAEVRLLLNVAGGKLPAILSVVDFVWSRRVRVATRVIGLAAGPAVLLAAAAARGMRSASVEARFFLNPIARLCPSPPDEWTPTAAASLTMLTGRGDMHATQADLEAGLRFTPDEACAYGLIDRVEPTDASLVPGL